MDSIGEYAGVAEARRMLGELTDEERLLISGVSAEEMARLIVEFADAQMRAKGLVLRGDAIRQLALGIEAQAAELRRIAAARDAARDAS